MLKWLDKYDNEHPLYVDGVKQFGLKDTLCIILGIAVLSLILHMIL